MKRTLSISLIFLFYLWTATNCSFKFDLSIKDTKYFFKKYNYNFLAQGFLSGQLHLPIKVPEEFLKLKNPYDPLANEVYRNAEEYRFHDLIFFKDKFYLYTGPTPAITLYIPYHLLTTRYLPDNLAAFIYMFGSFFWASFILFFLKDNYFKKTPEWLVTISVLVLGFSNVGGYLLRFPWTYEVAISSAVFFFMGTIYLIYLAHKSNNTNYSLLFLISLFAGLATGSRIYYGFSSILLLILLFYKKTKYIQNVTSRMKIGLVLIGPLSSILVLLAIYNYCRFGNIFDNGYKYTISLFNVAESTPLHIKHIISNFNYYLFTKPVVNSVFPFIYMNIWDKEGYPERIVGIITCTPFVLLLLFYPLIYLFTKGIGIIKENNGNLTFPVFEFLCIFLPFCSNFLALLLFHYVTMRYAADFMTLLVLSVIIIWFYFDLLIKNNKILCFNLRLLAIVLAIISIIFAGIFSITGSAYTLENHMDEIKRFEWLYMPISMLIQNFQH